MSIAKCDNQDCNAGVTGKCHIGEDDLKSCNFWKGGDITTKEIKVPTSKSYLNIPWTGNDLKLAEIENISRHSSPFVIGLVGQANSGKTSYLGALFTLLLNGYFLNDYRFIGSESLLRWEFLVRKLRYEKGKVKFPPPTPSVGTFYSFLHMVFRSNKQKADDILFADLSGEVFSQWTVDIKDSNVENVRWLIKNGDGFIFFVNAKSVAEKRMGGVYEILDMAQRVRESLNNRPIVAVWSKADQIENVSRSHMEKIEGELKQLFSLKEIYQISNYLDANLTPDPKSINNLNLLNELLNRTNAITFPKIVNTRLVETSDHFFNYSYNGK